MAKSKSESADVRNAKLVRLYVLARDAEKYAKLKRDNVADALKELLMSSPGGTLDTSAGIATLHNVEQKRFDQKKAQVILGPRFDECYTSETRVQLEVQPNREGEMAAASREFASVTEPSDASPEK